MFGQFGHFFKHAASKCDHPYPKQRYTDETKRLLTVLDRHLDGRTFLVGDEYSIADMATVPWVNALSEFYDAEVQLGLKEFKNVNAWTKRVTERPKTAVGMKVLSAKK